MNKAWLDELAPWRVEAGDHRPLEPSQVAEDVSDDERDRVLGSDEACNRIMAPDERTDCLVVGRNPALRIGKATGQAGQQVLSPQPKTTLAEGGAIAVQTIFDARCVRRRGRNEGNVFLAFVTNGSRPLPPPRQVVPVNCARPPSLGGC